MVTFFFWFTLRMNFRYCIKLTVYCFSQFCQFFFFFTNECIFLFFALLLLAQTEDFEPYFTGRKRLLPRPSDLSFYNWETQTATSNPTPNYQVNILHWTIHNICEVILKMYFGFRYRHAMKYCLFKQIYVISLALCPAQERHQDSSQNILCNDLWHNTM